MGYKVLGFAVWHGGRWYLRRRYGDRPRRVALGALVAAGIVAALVAQRRNGGG
jgi:hypothetical protein